MRSSTGLAEMRESFLSAHSEYGLSITHQEHKKSADLHQAAESSVEISRFGRLLSRTSTLLGQGTLPSPTAGSRIRFPESLLMLRRIIKRAAPVCQIRRSTLALNLLENSPSYTATEPLSPGCPHEAKTKIYRFHFHRHVSRCTHDSSMG